MASGDRKPTSLALWHKAVFFSLAFLFCAEVSRFLSSNSSLQLTFWLPAGLSVAVLLLNRTRDWPWLLAAALPAVFIFHWLHTPISGAIIFFFYVAYVLQAVVGAWLVRCFIAECPTLATLQEFFGLLGLGAVLGPIPGALVIAAAQSHYASTMAIVQSSTAWWAGSAMAILVFTPFVLTWCSKSTRSPDEVQSPERNVEMVFLLFALFILIFYLLCGRPGGGFAAGGWMILLSLWAGLRFYRRGASAVNLAITLAAAFFLAQHPVVPTAVPVGSVGYFFPSNSSSSWPICSH